MRLAKRNFLASAVLTMAAGSACAVPITYSFSGFSVGEYNTDTRESVIGSTIYSGSTAINGTFTYDNSAPNVGTAPVPGYNNAPFTVYSGAFSDMAMIVGGSSAGADLGVGLVGDNTPLQLDVLIGYSEASNPRANFSGFNVNDWTLKGLAFVFFNSPLTYDDESLPATPAASINLMELMFSNSTGENQKVRFSLGELGVVPVADVPEPSTALLFGLGLAGLLARRMGNKKKAF